MHRSRTRFVVMLSAMLTAAAFGVVAFPAASGAYPPKPYYLSLGDSYTTGFQPGVGMTPGYTDYARRKLRLQAENFGCAGATTTSMLSSNGCGAPATTDRAPYSGIPQAQAALDFIAAHPGAVSLVSVSIGGNDFDHCSDVNCVQAAMPTMQANIETLVGDLDAALAAAGDTNTKIIGLTYPDVELGLYVWPTNPPSSANLQLAQSSIGAFDSLINPTLSTAYHSVTRGRFVNVTTAPYKKAIHGDDTSLSIVQRVNPYGKVPAAVAEICKLTYFCSQGNIHGNTAGYTFIGKLLVAAAHAG